MLQFAANLTLLFTEFPYLDRFDAAANSGFTAVEILFPYDSAAKDTLRALQKNGLDLVLINAPPPNYTGGEPGYAAVPGADGRFRHDIRRVLRYAQELKPKLIHVMAGYVEGAEAIDTFVENLQWAADEAPAQGFTIEPLNQGDQPGYALSNYNLAAEVLARVDRPNVGLQFDSYHATEIHGDALAVWEKHKALVRHVQIGDSPGRTEPGKGRVDFPALFTAIESSGYAGWVSAEYKPTAKRTEDTLGWMKRT